MSKKNIDQTRQSALELNIVPGRRAVAEALRWSDVRQLILREGVNLKSPLSELVENVRGKGVQTQYLSADKFNSFCQSKSLEVGSAQGILALVSPKNHSLKEVLRIATMPTARGLLLACDQITDPQNLGALLRVAEASGVDGVIVTSEHSSSITPAVRKASVGASEILPIVLVTNLHRALSAAKEEGFWLVGAAQGRGSKPLYDMPSLAPAVLVMGAEGEGLRHLTKSTCDVLVEIPMFGRISSLNVSQAASVILYELVRRRLEQPGGSPELKSEGLM